MNGKIISALIAAAAVTAGIAACGGSAATTPRACKVARLAVNDMAAGAVNGQAMGTYASGLSYAARQPSEVQGETRTAAADALAAQQDASNGDFTSYKTDASRFVDDLRLVAAICKGLAGKG